MDIYEQWEMVKRGNKDEILSNIHLISNYHDYIYSSLKGSIYLFDIWWSKLPEYDKYSRRTHNDTIQELLNYSNPCIIKHIIEKGYLNKDTFINRNCAIIYACKNSNTGILSTLYQAGFRLTYDSVYDKECTNRRLLESGLML